jgi:membrane protein DedA with SNARE-associated domain
VDRALGVFRRHGILSVLVPSLMPPPMPFKIFVLSAGVFGVPWRRFALTLILARGLRYVFWGLLGIFFGDEALALLRAFDHWFDEEGWKVVMALVAAVLVALLVWLVRRRGRSVSTGGASGA